MEPISRDIFNKLVFCDSLFQFVELEENLFFTALDVDFHSIDRDMSKEAISELMVARTYEHFSKMSVFLKSDELVVGDVSAFELNEIIDQHFMGEKER